MPLFGGLHLALLLAIAVLAAGVAFAVQRGLLPATPTRLALGMALGANELIWWAFRYSHEGWRFPHNLPLQLCDVAVWMTVVACLTLWPAAVEVGWFAGMAGAGMALLTPDLWSPWPSYPAIYFFLAHGGIVVGMAVVVLGRIQRLAPGAPFRAFGWIAAFAALVGAFNAIYGTNYMYLCRKPASASVLDQLGPWPVYLAAGAGVALVLFWLLWPPVRRRA